MAHANNHHWIDDLKKEYPEAFQEDAKVLELGSRVVSGSISEYWQQCDYRGIDIVDGAGVDEVVAAADVADPDNSYDVIVAFSLFEHDPRWKNSLGNAIRMLKPGGYFFTCFGAEGNREHPPEPWQIVPHKQFLRRCHKLPVDVLDSFFEEDRYGPCTTGAYDVALRKVAA